MSDFAPASPQPVPEAPVLLSRLGPLGIITLNRPKALNALSAEMICLINPALDEWEADDAIRAILIRGAGGKAFCAGGDVREVWAAGRERKAARGAGTAEGTARAEEISTLIAAYFHAEYSLNHRIATFPKPWIALIDGITMGGGAGLSIHGTHRVATEATLFAMPETAIGIFPDVGASHFLSRLPNHAGRWLGLTGARLQAGDMLASGLATHYAPRAQLEGLEEELALTLAGRAAAGFAGAHAEIDRVLTARSRPAGAGILAQHLPTIERCFGGSTVEEIEAALAAEANDWAAEQLALLRSMSPTGLKLALATQQAAEKADLAGALDQEYRTMVWCMEGDEFYEGIRAVLIDKDRMPRWQPAELPGVGTDTIVGALAHPAPNRPLISPAE
ncbi:enoyl-CoA hydratase/isomerase family protein [Radicibacter daui]|uniref:enoyl-CoA hydratase/isomerase family protein n=1 Tax=Radicibacter daui TaxID=3064829 RepID=UPI004046AD66